MKEQLDFQIHLEFLTAKNKKEIVSIMETLIYYQTIKDV